uniref:hypothetical protein n=1 Tax=Phenylobacterium sp. CCH12-B4 TaxID=1768784 RepID=UPI000B13BE97
MWADGVFGGGIDAALLVGAASLYCCVVWQTARHLGHPRFPGAVRVFWFVAVVILPLPAYFAAGFGLWYGALLLSLVGLDAHLGAAVGLVLTPTLLSLLVL